jgi:hypothetical protein
VTATSSTRGYSSLVSGPHNGDSKDKERGVRGSSRQSAHLPSQSPASEQIRSETQDQHHKDKRSNSITTQQQRARNPKIVISSSSGLAANGHKQHGIKVADLQTTRTTKNSGAESKHLMTTKPRVHSQGKKALNTGSQPKVENMQLHIKKGS